MVFIVKILKKYKMKFLRILALVLVTIFTSCTTNNESPAVDESAGLIKLKEISNTTHTLELYTHMGFLQQGYNEISIRIKDKITNEYLKNASITWTPIMHMAMMNHSGPHSAIEKTTGTDSVYEGYLVFQMAQNTTEYWDLKIDYTINGASYSITTLIDVPASAKQRVTTFTGSDSVKYIIAYADPHHPKVGVNDMFVGVWKMQDMMTFPVVDNFKVKIDPRMPSMGNHSSPNNVDLTQALAGDLYNGKLSLTMTGLWKINLQLLNASGTVLKGETITDVVSASSIYFEIEF
jgi:hypothetical protein